MVLEQKVLSASKNAWKNLLKESKDNVPGGFLH